WNLGRQGSWYARMGDRLMAPLIGYQIQEPVQVNDFQLEQELETVAAILGSPRDKIKKSLSSLSDEPVRLALYEDVPRANAQTAPSAKQEAERILSQPLVLYTDDERFVISREQLGTWIVSDYAGDTLQAGLDKKAISTKLSMVR
ncbi:MAG: hypothetical protein KW806_03315, partial [Candidatus Yanofskybacteria bacterium]|nr:hypothetical protein [Candidatus Yanofskybacteria bacterium]